MISRTRPVLAALVSRDFERVSSDDLASWQRSRFRVPAVSTGHVVAKPSRPLQSVCPVGFEVFEGGDPKP